MLAKALLYAGSLSLGAAIGIYQLAYVNPAQTRHCYEIQGCAFVHGTAEDPDCESLTPEFLADVRAVHPEIAARCDHPGPRE